MSRAYPLVVGVLLGALVLFLRVFQLQVDQHEIWAGEALRLVHSGRVEPYRRGPLLDARGRVLARDRDAYHLVLKYRDFRRGHPLGQVAHARSSLEMRAVPLDEAHWKLDTWTDEFFDLDIHELERFGLGAALVLPTYVIGATDEPEAELRRLRASDLRYYIGSLMGLTQLEWRELTRLRREPTGPMSFAAFVAQCRGMDSASEVKEWRRAKNAEAILSLEQLALRMGWNSYSDDDPRRNLAPLERLVEKLEERRWAVENATAGRLFREATGFVAGRADPGTLATFVDLDWIQRALRWDRERLYDWLEYSTRVFRDGWRDEYAVRFLAAALCNAPTAGRADFEGRAVRVSDADRAVSSFAALFGNSDVLGRALDGNPVAWRELESLEVFDELGSLFEAGLPEGLEPEQLAVLPVQAPGLREWEPKRAEDTWRLLDYVRGDDTGADNASAWRIALSTQDREAIVQLSRGLITEWDSLVQERLRAVLTAIAKVAAPDGMTSEGALRIAEDRLSRATERARFIRKDYGSRGVLIDRRPAYEVVSLLTRYPARFPGFEPLEARERIKVVLDGEPGPLASELIGGVTPIDSDEWQSQRLEVRQLKTLRLEPNRTPAQNAELSRLMGIVRQSNEVRGADGLEALFDPVIRGRNGYREHRGLEDIYGKGGRWEQVRSVLHGKEVNLTLDADVQRAAEWVLEHPHLPPTEDRPDPAWFANPVGAIALVTIEGEIVVSASVPNAFTEMDPNDTTERGRRAERTLRRLTFQPIGSVFKPFVAAWMLEHKEVSPLDTLDCTRRDNINDKASWGGVRCSSTFGHGEVDMARALEVSCNSYFAWLGDQLSVPDLYAIAHEFGFDQPTGAGQFAGRGGLFEDSSIDWEGWQFSARTRRLAANGLGVIEGSVLQVARATAGLASGSLPVLRFVSAVDGTRVLPEEPRELEIEPRIQRFVRNAMFAVTNGREGSARKALSAEKLGFEVAAKTGSADYYNRGTRKHAWVTGFLPPEDPVCVFVVFLHDTTANASHGAVHVAHQFLQMPEFQTWLARRELAKARAQDSR